MTSDESAKFTTDRKQIRCCGLFACRPRYDFSRDEPGRRLATARDDDLLASLYAIKQLGKPCFGLWGGDGAHKSAIPKKYS